MEVLINILYLYIVLLLYFFVGFFVYFVIDYFVFLCGVSGGCYVLIGVYIVFVIIVSFLKFWVLYCVLI